MFEAPHKTAIVRKKISTPMKFLSQQNMLTGKTLDYGCGRGFDADALGMNKFDPFWHNVKISGKFDTITCNYVLNTISEEDGLEVIEKIKKLLKRDGKAYISVRRDIKNDTKTQRVVSLDLPVVKENSLFCMYKVTKESK